MLYLICLEVNNFKFGFMFLVWYEENFCYERFLVSFVIFMVWIENNGLMMSFVFYNVFLKVFGYFGLNISFVFFLVRIENYEINFFLLNFFM